MYNCMDVEFLHFYSERTADVHEDRTRTSSEQCRESCPIRIGVNLFKMLVGSDYTVLRSRSLHLLYPPLPFPFLRLFPPLRSRAQVQL